MSKDIALKRQVSIMLQRDGFKKVFQIVNDTILEKQYSSTQEYWKLFREELINQKKDEQKERLHKKADSRTYCL